MNSEIDIFWMFVDEVCKRYDVVIIGTDSGFWHESSSIRYICIDFEITLQCIHYWDEIVDEINLYKLLLGLNFVLFLCR